MYRAGVSLLFVFLVLCCRVSFAADKYGQGLQYPELVSRFYDAIHHRLYWMNTDRASGGMRKLLLQKTDSAAYIGTEKKRYSVDALRESDALPGHDSTALMKQDMLFTDAAIAYCKDLYQGYGIGAWMKYDEWSGRYAEKDNDFIIGHLAGIRSAAELAGFLHMLEPESSDYTTYKAAIATLYQNDQTARAKQVAIAMNFCRWIHHFGFERYIVVNIPAASMRYFEEGRETLFSKMIVGKPSTRTPRFSATCRDVILYPYWNVPTDIALKELVPKYKKSHGLPDKENMQILDNKGNVVNPYSIDWSRYSSRYFPYRLRQSTGCDNSLGIFKFDLTSPFGVYLHDTNNRELFQSLKRFRSHGCMRVDKAIQLGNMLLNNKLDTAFLQACVKGEKPITMHLEKPVPVFVVYLTAGLNENGSLVYYDDVYRLSAQHN